MRGLKISMYNLSTLIFIIFIFIFPFFIRNDYILHLFILLFIFGIATVSYDIEYGYAGLVNLGFAAFFGAGAYTSALTSIYLSISPWIGMVLGGVSSILICLPIGLVALRLKGHYLAIVTIGLAEVLRLIYARVIDMWTKGETGLWGIPPLPNISFPGIGYIDFSGAYKQPYYISFLIIFLVIFYFYRSILKTKIGLAFIAVREDERVASTSGIDTVKYKLLAFTLSAFTAGIAGAMYAHYINVIAPDIFGLPLTVELLTMMLLGGTGTLIGPAIGTLLVVFLTEYLRAFGMLRMVIYGLAVVVIVILYPKGIMGGVYKLRVYIRKYM